MATVNLLVFSGTQSTIIKIDFLNCILLYQVVDMQDEKRCFENYAFFSF